MNKAPGRGLRRMVAQRECAAGSGMNPAQRKGLD